MNASKFTTWTFVIFLLFSAILVVHLLFGFLNPVIMSMVIVSIFKPIHISFKKAFRNREYFAATLSTALVILGVLIPLSIFLVALAQQGLLLIQALQKLTSSSEVGKWAASLRELIENLNSYLVGFNVGISTETILSFATTISQAIVRWIYGGVGFFATNILSLVLNFLLTVALVFVFFVSGTAAKEFVMDLIPLPSNEKERLSLRFRELSLAIFVGNGSISLLEGLLGGLSFLVLGVSGALVWGVIMAITAFLPVIGASIVVIPATIYFLVGGKFISAIIFFAFNTVQLSILETFVKPKLIGTKSQMHAVLVFLSIIAGVQIYGVFGLFYGPLLVTLFLALAEIYKEHYRDNLLKY